MNIRNLKKYALAGAFVASASLLLAQGPDLQTRARLQRNAIERDLGRSLSGQRHSKAAVSASQSPVSVYTAAARICRAL